MECYKDNVMLPYVSMTNCVVKVRVASLSLSVQCSVFSVRWSVFSGQCSVVSIQCSVFGGQCSVWIVQCSVANKSTYSLTN